MNVNPTAVLWLGRIYLVISVALWPVTTIISTALAVSQKVPDLRPRRAAPPPRATARG
jgi:hypothetical protein